MCTYQCMHIRNETKATRRYPASVMTLNQLTPFHSLIPSPTNLERVLRFVTTKNLFPHKFSSFPACSGIDMSPTTATETQVWPISWRLVRPAWRRRKRGQFCVSPFRPCRICSCPVSFWLPAFCMWKCRPFFARISKGARKGKGNLDLDVFY